MWLAAGNDRLAELLLNDDRASWALSERDTLVLFASGDELDAAAKDPWRGGRDLAIRLCGVRIDRIGGSAREFENTNA